MDISIRDLGRLPEGARRRRARERGRRRARKGVRRRSRPGLAARASAQGKVPRSLIEKKFGRELKEDVANELVGKAVEKAVKDHELELVSQPEVDTPPAPPEAGQDLSFTFRVEVKPTFELPEYKGVAVDEDRRGPSRTRTSTAVIEDLRFRHGVLKPVARGLGLRRRRLRPRRRRR